METGQFSRQQKDGICKVCSRKLRARENSESILMVCINPGCRNYWINKGSEIIMILK
ncbi:hypothetical protein HYY70_07035 [Candidatus Woesearchaeota archaeon]|nr:hypothetical protein [Candidatus Woesearchaeota archaeon]